MATRTGNRSTSTRSSSTRSSSSNGSRDKSAFSWGSPGAIAGAALGGAALAIAANLGRKLAVQGLSARKGDWAESLAAEHQMVLGVFDKMLATDDSQTVQRSLLLMKLGHALDKHAYAEEHVVYPALREANDAADAEELETEHGEVKTFLYRLNNMKADAPEWLDTVREFRQAVSAHASLEEDEIFPRLRASIGEELDQRITSEVNKAGFAMA